MFPRSQRRQIITCEWHLRQLYRRAVSFMYGSVDPGTIGFNISRDGFSRVSQPGRGLHKWVASRVKHFSSVERGLPVDLWTIPSDQPKPFGTWGRTVDNKKAVAHSSTTLLCLSTTGPTGSICKYYNFDRKRSEWVQRQITALLEWRLQPGEKTRK
jgi:hypothetical protein